MGPQFLIIHITRLSHTLTSTRRGTCSFQNDVIQEIILKLFLSPRCRLILPTTKTMFVISFESFNCHISPSVALAPFHSPVGRTGTLSLIEFPTGWTVLMTQSQGDPACSSALTAKGQLVPEIETCQVLTFINVQHLKNEKQQQ